MLNMLSDKFRIIDKIQKRANDFMKEKKTTKTVLYTRFIPGEENALSASIRKNELRFIHVDHSATGNLGKNFIELARKDSQVKDIITALANRGFMAYTLREGTTSFVHYERVPTLWKKVQEGEFSVDENGLVYKIEQPLSGHAVKNLLVIFSSMAGKIYTPSLMRHFEQNFASVQKYAPPGTAVLRIADLGGVVGAYYMNTNALPNNEDHVQSLVCRTMAMLSLHQKDVVLYGVSKGGTAALLHGIRGGFKVVSIDPILADEHYIVEWQDSHFTTGVFPEDKKDRFSRLFFNLPKDSLPPISIITSDRSPQYPYIMNALSGEVGTKIALFNSMNPDISKHPDVGPKTVNLAVMLINSMIYGIPPCYGKYSVDDLTAQPAHIGMEMPSQAAVEAGALSSVGALIPVTKKSDDSQGAGKFTETLFASASAVLRLKPPVSEAGKVEYRGDLTKIEDQLKEFLRMNPGNAPAQLHLSRVLDKLGHRQDAVSSWKALHTQAVAAFDLASFGLGSAYAKAGELTKASELLSSISSQFKDTEKLAKMRGSIENDLSIESAMNEAETVLDSVAPDADRDEGHRLLASALRKSQLNYCKDDRVARMLANAYDVACAFAGGRVETAPTDNLTQYRALQGPVTVRRDGARVICTAGFSWSGSGAVTDMLSGYENVGVGLSGRELNIFRFYTDVLGIFDRGGFSGRELLYLLIGPVLGIVVDKRQLTLRRGRSLFKAHADAGGDISGLISACEDLIREIAGTAGIIDEAERAARALAALRRFCNAALDSVRVDSTKFTLLNNIILGVHIRQFALFDDVIAIAVKRDPRDQYVSQIYDKPRFAMPSVDEFIKGVRAGRQQFEKAMAGLNLQDRVIELNFEDFVLNASVREKLLRELQIDPVRRSDTSLFDASASAKNVGIYKNFPDQNAIRKIADALPDYLNRNA